MRKSTLNKYIVLIALLALFSCKAKKLTVVSGQHPAPVSQVKSTDTTAAVANTKTAAEILRESKLAQIRAMQVDFTTFSGKASAKLNINGDKNDVTMNIRIKKGKQIWVSITAILGVEVARALITPDSIKVMNRLESTYLKKPFSFVYGYTSRQINYQTLESILIGNAIPELVSDSASLKPDNGNLIITGLLRELVYHLTLNPGLKVSQVSMANMQAAQSLQIDNSAFIQTGSRVIPSQVNINSSAKQNTIQANLHYTKAEFDAPVELPFNVPARFEMLK